MADALGTPGGVVSDEDHRLAQAGLIAPQTSSLAVRTGVLLAPGSTALVTGTPTTGTMTVAIAAHHWVTTRASGDGVYIGTLEAATTVNIAAAPGANSRIDVVYVKQNDTGSSITPDTGSTAPLYGVATGTVAVSPVKPSIPVGAIELSTVQVAAGATATNGANVTITNTARQTVMRGAPVPVATQAERDALTLFTGLRVLRLDQAGLEQWYDGAKWRYPGDFVTISSTSARSTLNLYAGLRTIALDTGAESYYTGSAWRDMGGRVLGRIELTASVGPYGTGRTTVAGSQITFTLTESTRVEFVASGKINTSTTPGVGRVHIVCASGSGTPAPDNDALVIGMKDVVVNPYAQSFDFQRDKVLAAGTWTAGLVLSDPIGGGQTATLVYESNASGGSPLSSTILTVKTRAGT